MTARPVASLALLAAVGPSPRPMQPEEIGRRPTDVATTREADRDALDAARVLAGEVDAFAGIVERWQGPLVNLAFRFCRDRSRAEDLAQEAFLKAFRSLASFRGESAFSTWLIALAVNVYRSGLRRSGPPLIALDELAEERIPTAVGVDLVQEDLASAVRGAVAGLPGRYRDALVLFYFEERNVEEAAAVLNVPQGTLKARLHRGRKLLAERVEKWLGKGAPAAAWAEKVEEV
jgi:RNA polymerase sigma-70 factor (ECF subfamily)